MRHHLQILAYIIFVLATVFSAYSITRTTARRLAHAQYNACLRGNVLRQQINVDNMILSRFLIESIPFYVHLGGPAWTKRARQYTTFASEFKQVPLPDCHAVIYSH